MSIKATITAVGPKALSDRDPMVILFDDSATAALRQVAVIQRFLDQAAQRKLRLAAGDTLTIDETTYTITAVGALANANLQSIGHVTLMFAPQPKDGGLANALYLSPAIRPRVVVGSTLDYRPAE
ncbi:PTS glucitol/sorbitol transporter subunit IIA [Lacticaseibacillus suihuaensis]